MKLNYYLKLQIKLLERRRTLRKNKKHRKSNKNNKKILQKVYTPRRTQDIIKYLFKEVDERTGIFKITDDEYSICMEYTD